jgi:hypothetical protein
MPEISRFFGMIITMYWNEHNPPHFHVEYGEESASIDIKQLKMTTGNLSRRALNMILDWAELHQQELLDDWELCQKSLVPNRIEPLK